ncbi:MAG TPA: hypothetical protein VMX55_11095 [candidate division Zixibacteria bacterium]|nr:hypothetical protein [candidate division Zixibacteria bacterium]
MSSKEKVGLKESITENVVDFKNELEYKQSLLREQKIPVLTLEESKQFGLFKIEFHESEGFYSENLLVEKDVDEILLYKINDSWKEVLDHTLYSYEKELDHGKEYIFKNAPLIRFLYIDIEEEIFFLEDLEGMLYCSIDKIHWFTYLVPLESRPYYKREDYLRKFQIPNY